MSGRLQGPGRADRLAGFGVALLFCLGSALVVAAVAIVIGSPVVVTLLVAVLAAVFVAAAVSQ